MASRNVDTLPTDFTGDPDVIDDDDLTEPDDIAADFDRERARETLQAAYREYLGREMTEADFEGWWSGAYGWGRAGIEGLDDWLRGIRHEGDRLKSVAADPTVADPTETGEDNTGVPDRTGQAPPGWDPTKWADPDHHTVKYDAAAFLYGLTKPSEIDAMVKSAAFQARFPGATFNGKDKIDFGSVTEDGVPVGVIDVLMRSDKEGDTSAGLWWGDTGNDPVADPTGADTLDTRRTGADTLDTRRTGADTRGSGEWTRDAWAEALLNAQGGRSPLLNPAATPGPPSMGYGGGGTMGQMITPYNPLATYSPVPYVPPAPFRPPAYEGATPFQQDPYQAATPFGQDPYAAAAPFTGPTAADMAADPGYQFRLRQGQEALERSGAARGVTNTGGTLRDILDYGQQAASQEYGNVFGRQRDVYDLNERNRFNAYQANYGNAMDAYAMNEANRFGAFDVNAANRYRTYAMNEANRAGAFDRNVGTARDAYAMNQANRFQGYQTNELARWQENQEAEARRSGAYGTNLGAYERQQQQGLRAQGQGFDQAYRNWQEQYNQGRLNAQDTYNRMYGLSTT